MAPPLTLVLSRFKPNSFSTARYCAEKASLTSIRSICSKVKSARLRAWRMAGAGPMPMISGGTPASPPGDQPGHRLQVMLLYGISGGHNDTGTCIIDAASIARGHDSSLAEACWQLG